MKTFLTTAAAAALCATSSLAANVSPEIWAHRGATYLSYENTLEAFALGKTLGATGFELDLVLTKDKDLAVYHDLTLNESTNVEALFDQSRARQEVDSNGNTVFNYYVEDFTMAELRTLTLEVSPNDAGVRNELATDPNNPYAVDPSYIFRIPNYSEALDLLDTSASGQKVLTEVKLEDDGGTPQKRQDIVDALVAEWTTRGYTTEDGPIVVQSFSFPFMQDIDAAIDTAGLKVPTFQLDAVGIASRPDTPKTQAELNALVANELGNLDGLALFQGMYLIDTPPFAGFVNPFGLDYIEAANAAGLETYVWTLSKPAEAPLADYYNWLQDPSTPIDFGDLYQEFYALGLDGIITDTPDIAVATYADFVAPVPLPAGGLLLLSGLGFMALRRRG